MAESGRDVQLPVAAYPSADGNGRFSRACRFRSFAAPFLVNARDAMVIAVPAAITLSTVAIGRIAAAVYALVVFTRPSYCPRVRPPP
jgi:hypothetical protein